MPRLMVAAAAAAVTAAAAAPVGWQPQLQLCEDVSSCDAWAAATPHAISVGIALLLPPNHTRADGDIILGCAEAPGGKEEIAAYRASHNRTLRLIADAQLAPHTDCILLSIPGGGVATHAERRLALRELYEALPLGTGLDALAPPTASSSAPVPPIGNLSKRDDKEEIIRLIDEASYMRELRLLTGADPIQLPDGSDYTIATRNTNQPSNLVACEHMVRVFEAAGFEDVSLQEFTFGGGTQARNVVARLPGTGSGAGEIVVVGGHFDSLPGGALAPSAVDNGSGTIGMIELAQIFAQFTFNRTIEFVAFGAEEQGLHGSAHYVAEAQARGETIVAALTMDMIGYSNQFYGVLIEGTTDPAIQQLMDLCQENTLEFAPQLTIARSDFSFGSDHVSFQRAGIPAILMIEQDDTNYVCYHRDCDDVSYINPGQATDIVRGLGGGADRHGLGAGALQLRTARRH